LTDPKQSQSTGWDEKTSQDFLDYGKVFVPYRDLQLQVLSGLIPAYPSPFRILELCCGDGLLGSSYLERHGHAVWMGLDGSPVMLERAEQRMARFGERARLHPFDLQQTGWRQGNPPYHAVVSSMAIHHLEGEEKRQLYIDLFSMLAPGGILGIADIIQPVGEAAVELAARQWDEAVWLKALELEEGLRLSEIFFREGWNIFRFPDPMDKPSPLLSQLKWLEEAGFWEVNIYWLNAGHAVFGVRKPGGKEPGTGEPGGRSTDGG